MAEETSEVRVGSVEGSPADGTRRARSNNSQRALKGTKNLRAAAAVLTLGILGAVGLWVGHLTMEVKQHLSSAVSLLPQIKVQVAAKNGPESHRLLSQVQDHVRSANAATGHPLWEISSHLPLIGKNFTAVSDVTQAADSVVTGAGGPLLATSDILASGRLTRSDGVLDLALVKQASKNITLAAVTTERASSQLRDIDRGHLVAEVSRPLDEITTTFQEYAGQLNEVARIAKILPSMLGSDGPRNYLVLVQNNAEVRATGGLPGALAVIRIQSGKFSLAAQATGSDLGKFVPPVAVEPEQERIFTSRLGAYISDVNFTPDFPSAARTAKEMWEVRYSTLIDGVVAIDPIVLSHILAVSGPLPLEVATEPGSLNTLPTTLTSENVVKTLLSDVYAAMDNRGQDYFFAAAAKRVFEVLSTGKVPLVQLAEAAARSSEENRIRVWSQWDEEQVVLESLRSGGSISSGPDAGPNSFGAFFNDGTGAKMDYHVRRRVQLIRECPVDGYAAITVRITSENTAAHDSATSLSTYVTGGGNFGVAPGTVRTNIVVYGPAHADVETAKLDGTRVSFAPYRHRNRPVGVVTTQLAPGESRTVDINFGRVTLDFEPEVIVTPTVENVHDVLLPTHTANCN